MFHIDVKYLDMVADPKLYNYGGLRDCIRNFTGTFTAGKIYGIVGDFGSGNWALSYILAGRCDLSNEAEIMIDDKKVDTKLLQEVSCYVGDLKINEPTSNFKKHLNGKWSIGEQIKRGIIKSKSQYSYEQIVEIFDLSGINDKHGRIHRIIENIGIERWRATMAIGFAEGKRLFCFPLLMPGLLRHIVLNYEFKYIKFLIDNGAIIIVPVTDDIFIKHIADEIIYLKDCDKDRLIDAINNQSR